jgi:hypothetical protein
MKRTHGLSKTRFYGIWNDMVMRCHNPNKHRYENYGGRGIVVCDRWRTFQNFYDDMFLTYKPGLTLERNNVNGNYEADNCRWATWKEQGFNKTNTLYLTIYDIRYTAADWAFITGTDIKTIYSRHENGWSDRDCAFEPLQKKSYSKEQVDDMRLLRSQGHSLREIGRRFGTSHASIKHQLSNYTNRPKSFTSIHAKN